jgi:hypothetical protein
MEIEERIKTVSGGRKIGNEGRCRTPVGSTVDMEKASYTNTIGDSQLNAAQSSANNTRSRLYKPDLVYTRGSKK